MTHKVSRKIDVRELARVEGEGALHVRVRGGVVHEARLDIYEPPRFFEAFLRGRCYTEPPDITARICGICPVAYQMSSCQALEAACGVTVEGAIADLRRLLYCAEWIESHTLHIYLLHAPDFLGYDSVVALAKDAPELVQRGLKLKQVGNELLELIGGRAIHPVNIRLGGFYRAPTRREFRPVVERLHWALEAAVETVRLVSGFVFPDYEHDHEYVALSSPGTYAIDRGRLRSTGGLDITPAQFEEHIGEEHVAHSTALHARIKERGRYLVGPQARYTLNGQWLSPVARQAADEAGLGETCRNPFRSIIVRAVETVYAVEEALRLLADYQPPDPPYVKVPPRAGVGHGITEAPRGSLFHRYELDADGIIQSARIVPPTSQSQPSIEDDLRGLVETHLDLPDDELTLRCEQAIRNYDPCISCATHFLHLEVDRG